MDYNEYDDYGTGYEEQAEAMHDAMIDTQIAIIRDEQILAFFAPRWGADMGEEIAALLKK